MNNMLKTILKPAKYVSTLVNNSSTWGKLLIFIAFLLIGKTLLKEKMTGYEGIEGMKNNTINDYIKNNAFSVKTGNDIYDDFYSNIYDHLLFSNVKDSFEIDKITELTDINEDSNVLDIGSGTGHHAGILNKKGIKTIGIDNSAAMIKKSKELYPDYEFINGDATESAAFHSQTFTHILCLYFTIYYFKDKMLFFNNAMNWLMPGGHLVVHIVDRDMFDPIIPPSNPLLMLTPQRYAEKRITKSAVTFHDFKYDANFELDKNNNNATFIEKFKNKENGKIFRRHDHKMYMESEKDILEIAKEAGFIVKGKIDLIKAGYEYNYLYIFQKAS